MIKVVAANVVMDVLDRAIQVHGALGMSDDTPLAWMWRFSRMLRVADGPDEVHKMVIARRELQSLGEGRREERPPTAPGPPSGPDAATREGRPLSGWRSRRSAWSAALGEPLDDLGELLDALVAACRTGRPRSGRRRPGG